MTDKVLKHYLNLIENGHFKNDKDWGNFMITLRNQTGSVKLTDEQLHEIEIAWVKWWEENKLHPEEKPSD